jgi:hypothetical protein
MAELCWIFWKPSRAFPPTRCVGDSGVMRGFEGLEFADQGVVLGVGNLGGVEHVVLALVVADGFAQGFRLKARIVHGMGRSRHFVIIVFLVWL